MASRRIEPEVLSWLLDQGSLTRRLMNYCPGQFSVRVLKQAWVNAEIDETRLLGIPLGQRVLARQVQLCCCDRVVVYARSIIPLKTLKGRHRRLLYIGNRPLGAYLFANPGLKRKNQHFSKILRRDALFNTALSDGDKQCDHIWGRRSLFIIDQKPLLVSEFFLPELLHKHDNDNNPA